MAKEFKALSVFSPRDYPTAIFVGEDCVTGPFCQNCGFALTFHVTGKVRGGTHKGETITACPPPNGMNPMDPRCTPCTLAGMKLSVPFGAVHLQDCPARGRRL